VKKDDEEFEAYDPNIQTLKILQWKDEYEEADSSL